jgi:hypothetical protein
MYLLAQIRSGLAVRVLEGGDRPQPCHRPVRSNESTCPRTRRSPGDISYDFFFTTSSMLVPKSLSMTDAAFRPGIPVTEPPGAVVAPV